MAMSSGQSIRDLIKEKKAKNSSGRLVEKAVPVILLLTAIVSVLTTLGILYTLIVETVIFFSQVPFIEFITKTEWLPFASGDENKVYGISALVSGTLLVTLIATIVAVPFGLGAAIYLSEYASDRVRRIVKPILEILAGIPTIVYGFFALTFVTPLLQKLIPDLPFFNALSPGIVVGIMIIPMIASLSDDAMSSVPNAIREGALALGATKFELAIKIILPAAISGVVASFVLGISRAIGETMIVTLAGGSNPNFTFNPTETIQTMTSYIVQASTGDAGFGTTQYYSIYAVGMTLFVFTLLMNILAQYISRRFREEY
ncbi:phosphate ABC transporter permease subunit PstC [Metabacillus sp. KIGAM252]|uniref:Phosphate transport system permease protein n=1 Tax=Metabacillus flavus TaxID=2823519 RepID=A0ABS5LG21_9BACI|nr:phosphate ABC transporter permease subunit PstC [Metabacillus flavus]MBS2969700.1 phosphate ABC transporter permease subunit PstC [Metabacillus flavus]